MMIVGIESIPSHESSVQDLIRNRRDFGERARTENKSINETLRRLDNDYTPLADLYREKTGYNLISDPEESQRHEVPITKSCSIVIPAYNNSARLERCLASIQASSFNAKYPQLLEIIVVDDGSPSEDIAAKVRAMGINDLNLKVIRQQNGQIGKARYCGTVAACNEIIIFTDPDVVYSPFMIEEYMKRHQILDNVILFGFRSDISPDDPRIQPNQVAGGSLTNLPADLSVDSRVHDRGMADSNWLAAATHNQALPIDVNNPYYGWSTTSVPWGLSFSAKREDCLTVFSGWEPDFVSYGYDDQLAVSCLLALGNYVIPNTGGLVFHQDHPKQSNNPAAHQKQFSVLDRDLNQPLKTQNPIAPVQLHDAKMNFKQVNTRLSAKTRPSAMNQGPALRGANLMRMGLISEASQVLGKFIDAVFKGEQPAPGQEALAWVEHDYAKTLLDFGKSRYTHAAVEWMKRSIQKLEGNCWANVSMAEVYARNNEYEAALYYYRKALKLDPINSDAQRIQQSPEVLHQLGVKYRAAGKLRRALTYYDAAITAGYGIETQPWSAFDKAGLLMDLGDPQSAWDILARLQNILGENEWFLAKLGQVQERLGNTTEARRFYSWTLKVSPQNYQAIAGLQRIG